MKNKCQNRLDINLKAHALPVGEVLKRLDVNPESGLTDNEAERRIFETGPNRFDPPARRTSLQRFIDQFRNALIYVLLCASVVTALLGHFTDAVVIVGVVFVNAIVGYIQEGRAEKALDAVKAMLSPDASVVRDGRRTKIKAENLVPGDIVELRAGDRIPADIRLTMVKNLLVLEAALTGESDAVEKKQQPVAMDAVLGDRQSMAYGGTFVTFGLGKGVVTATGNKTEIGHISKLLEEVQKRTTPLILQMDDFSRKLTIIIIVLAVVTFNFGVWIRGFPFSEMLLAAVGLAVAAIPEGLPAVMTITLALGVTRMARRNAIIRRLPAVETLGSVSIICSDKTGTLTRNELMVQTVVTPDKTYTVSGSGYSPDGKFREGQKEAVADSDPDLKFIGMAAALCNDSEVRLVGKNWISHGSPTDAALVSLAMKTGQNIDVLRKSMPAVDLIPFDSAHKFMATLNCSHEGNSYIFIKGAAERILNVCTYEGREGKERPLDRKQWEREIEVLADDAQRVLAIAWRKASVDKQELKLKDLEKDLSLIGLFGIIDPPREEAIEAIVQCRKAGISVKMITGDHLLTAKAIGRRFHLGVDSETEKKALSGADLDRMSPEQFTRDAAICEIFARTTPEHKLRLVEALQVQNKVVAMTGDGVNDAPALKRADIGVAMGIKGTEVAKEAAGIVLADDNFATIVHAVEEGRTVYKNLIKTILFVLPTSAGEAMTIITAVILGQTLPITPLQILWINMVTMVTLGLALAFERADPNVMSQPPRDPLEPILSAYLIWRVISVSVLILIVTFGLYQFMSATGASIDRARTVAVNGLVAAEIANLLNCRSVKASMLSWQRLIENKVALGAIAAVLAMQLIFTYTPAMQSLFASEGLSWVDWVWVLAAGLLIFFAIEIEKLIIRGKVLES